jgi:hypothetical protein
VDAICAINFWLTSAMRSFDETGWAHTDGHTMMPQLHKFSRQMEGCR